jgi:RHH-type transcriptional regulator, proline utilization regulon repressor / proline dehydrogenase / delta 1-pyrroline-5-carboxylate dehydrogenase
LVPARLSLATHHFPQHVLLEENTMALFGLKSKSSSAKVAAPMSVASPLPATRPPVETNSTPEREAQIMQAGSEMLDIAKNHKSGLLSAKFYQDKLMDWSMKDHNFKVQLFRFVDAFPALTTPEMVHDHLVDYLTQPGVKAPPFMDLGLKAGGVAKGMMTKTISSQINNMAKNFIAGTDANDALPMLSKLWKNGIAFSVDLLGEACVSNAEADAYQAKYLDLVENLVGEASSWSKTERLESDHLGVVPRVNVSIKVTSLCAQFNPIAPESSIADFMTRATPVFEAAKRNGVLINFDMEQHELKDLTLDTFMHACESVDFEAGLAMQAYLKSGVEDAKRISQWAKRTGKVVTVRLVKGAYWDYETINAEQEGWPCPVWNEKWQTDQCFEQMVEVFLDACPTKPGEGGIKLALGSHNVRSIAAALAGLDKRGLPRKAIELQMLHGMADQLKYAAEEMGLRVREYVPVGEMIPGMAYLVRRLLENTSNESWLKSGFLDNADTASLLADPTTKSSGTLPRDLYEIAADRHQLSPAHPQVGDGRPFYTEPMRDFAQHDQRIAFAKTMQSTSVPTVPNDRTVDQGLAMIEAANNAFPAWRDVDPIKRSAILMHVAEMMIARRDELSAIVCKEARKTWHEADADVCEAIDFCTYYARTAPELFTRKRLGRFIGELDELWYQPKGVAVVISPWNFPLAICCGMTVAALVTGNTVVLKPAEQTPGIAKVLFDIITQALTDAHAPADVIHFCPAPGETTGAALVRDPRVSVIAFTGSKAVGLDIIKAAGNTTEDQLHVKRVISEMGGKNAIIIDASADLDEAVLGVRYSAFGFQGQKCSACSRCIVVDPQGPDGPRMKMFLERLGESTKTLILGAPDDPNSDVSPVIDAEAADNINRFIQSAKDEGLTQLVGAEDFNIPQTDGKPIDDLIAPHIFTGVNESSTIYTQEIFGPVLAVIHASDFNQAMKLANGHAYKLTGGIFTRKPTHIDQAKAEFRVGNLYVNRGCTGALVGRQPFGGFGMSGVGSKAGGPDYLHQFVDPRASSENTMRRGFAPEL